MQSFLRREILYTIAFLLDAVVNPGRIRPFSTHRGLLHWVNHGNFPSQERE